MFRLVTWNSHFEKRATGIPGIPGNSREFQGIQGNPGNPRLWREVGSRAPYIDYKINYTSQDVHNIPN